MISNLGFPIAVCIFLFYYVTNMQNQHKDEMDKMSNAINNNTLVIQKLLDKLDAGDLNE